MKSILTLMFIILAATFSSCSSENDTSENQIGTEENTYDIEIENNKKWVVIEDMMVHIQNMDDDIESTGNVEKLDFEGLWEKLDANINLLTSNCTMTGKAHDELHKWLIPFIGLVEDLNNAETYDDKMGVYSSLEASMLEFNAYFE
ncbi:MAG: hypothetical protein P8P74_13895 [Crocinitomicaceae bacterium]|nr:hypothetical protein [Crocinitomicaceae bacterium]